MYIYNTIRFHVTREKQEINVIYHHYTIVVVDNSRFRNVVCSFTLDLSILSFSLSRSRA